LAYEETEDLTAAAKRQMDFFQTLLEVEKGE
jgi:hypothetical protein